MDQIKTPIHSEGARQSSSDRSDRIGVWRDDVEADKKFVASLTDASAVHGLMLDQRERGVIDDCEQHHLRVFEAAVHAVRCKPRINRIDETGRRKMFWKMIWGIKRPTPNSEQLFKNTTIEEADEASALMKLAKFGDPRARGFVGAQPVAKPARPPRPEMSIDSKRAVSIRDWALLKKWNFDGGIACGEARRRFGWSKEDYLAHLVTADEAIERWQRHEEVAEH